VPTIRSFDFSGLSMPMDEKQSLFNVDSEEIIKEIIELKSYNTTLGDHPFLKEQIDSLDHHIRLDESHPPTENKYFH
jgi:hypothetical protein